MATSVEPLLATSSLKLWSNYVTKTGRLGQEGHHWKAFHASMRLECIPHLVEAGVP